MTAPTPSELEEMVARAIARAEGAYVTGNIAHDDPDEAWADHWSWYLKYRGSGGMADRSAQARWDRQARAALAVVRETLREPTPEMVTAGGLAFEKAMYEDQLPTVFDAARASFIAQVAASPLGGAP